RSRLRVARPGTRIERCAAFRHARRHFRLAERQPHLRLIRNAQTRPHRNYAGYGTPKSGVIEILDRDKLIHGPKDPTAANLESPMIARLDLPPDVGAHTTFPMIGVDVPNLGKYGPAISKRNFLLIVGETTDNECQAVEQMMHIFDITDESKIFGITTYYVPEPSGNFCSRG